MNRSTRRRFLAGAGVGTAAALAALAIARRSVPGVKPVPEAAPRSSLETVVHALLPGDARLPSALDAGVVAYLERTLEQPQFRGVRALLQRGIERLERAARGRFGRGLAELDADAVLALLDAQPASDTAFAWPAFRDALLDFSLEGYLGHPARGGNREGRVFRSLGLEPPGFAATTADARALFEAPRTLAAPEQLAAVARERWDAIVIGSGAGGGVAADRLAAGGARVLVLEKGPRLPARALVPDEIGSCLRDAFVPFVSDDPHVLWEGGRARRSFDGWTACCVGGGTVHMSAMLYRMHEEDFDAVTRFGRPDATTAIDWPLRYRDLQPYYDRIQAEIGLSGETGANPFEPAAAPYPLPPLAAHSAAAAVERAARALGLHPFPTPRGLLSQSYRGRRACVQCGYCGAYACPVNAKASSADVFLARAEQSGRCRVLPGAPVLRIDAARARVRGVIALDREGGQHALLAPRVVLAASAVESARLLLASESQEHPHGLGNASGQVGKNLLFSLEATGRAAFAFGSELFPRAQEALPFLNRSVQDHYLDREAPGGYPKIGTLVLERAHPNPIQRARRAAREEGGMLGAQLVERIGRTLRDQREIVYETFVEMLPRPGLAVSLDPEVRGAGGSAAARISLDELGGEAERAARLGSRARELLASLRPLALTDDGAPRRTMFLQVGTCRMGSAEDSSVCDARGRVRGVEGLVVADGSALPSMGGVPPTLTIMANALRVADLLVRTG